MTQITSVPFHGTNILTDETLPRIIQPADVRDGDRIAAEFEDGWETVIANGPRMLRTPRCIVLLERPEPEPVWPTDECIITALPRDWERCSEHVVRRRGGEPCDLPVVAVRINPDDESLVYPVCKNHVRGCMVPLDSIRTDLIHEVREQVAREIERHYLGPDSGRSFDGRDAPDAAERDAFDEGLRHAARIARVKDA